MACRGGDTAGWRPGGRTGRQDGGLQAVAARRCRRRRRASVLLPHAAQSQALGARPAHGRTGQRARCAPAGAAARGASLSAGGRGPVHRLALAVRSRRALGYLERSRDGLGAVPGFARAGQPWRECNKSQCDGSGGAAVEHCASRCNHCAAACVCSGPREQPHVCRGQPRGAGRCRARGTSTSNQHGADGPGRRRARGSACWACAATGICLGQRRAAHGGARQVGEQRGWLRHSGATCVRCVSQHCLRRSGRSSPAHRCRRSSGWRGCRAD